LDLLDKRVTRSDFLSIELFKAILDRMELLRQLMEREFDKRVLFNEIDVSCGKRVVPLPQLINALERNLDLLAHGGYGAGQMQPTMEWNGELNDRRRLSFEDVNRWIESLQIMNNVVRGIFARMLVTRNGLHCGGDRTRQKLRSV